MTFFLSFLILISFFQQVVHSYLSINFSIAYLTWNVTCDGHTSYPQITPEAEYDQQGGGTHGIVNNIFGDVLGLVGSGSFIPYNSVLGGYGVMPGSENIPTPLQPQWRSRYADTTGFYYMGVRYYEPTSGRFLSTDPLGHNLTLIIIIPSSA